ncbi:hypothetical protein D9613_011242 [Agrocybe pediades]|uniref:Uncharacterized protein n=1 Tax=Agrocybe pediades TaxID=84607 RepID=A0A8H4QS44_9AGAR|nr:hypothetical protein D9613_011242 [Agrocybe pediades]
MRDLTFYEGDVGGVLHSLSSMPYLEKLVIHWKSNIHDSHPFHEVVKLPFLNHLETTTSVNVLVALLDGLSILPFTLRIINCVLKIQHLSPPTLDSNSLRERMERLVRSYGQSGVPVPELCHLHLTFDYNGLKLVMYPSFTLEVFTNFLIQDKADATNLVNAFKLRKLSEITFLVLRVSDTDHYYTSLAPLLTSMYSVTTLDVLETFFPVANLEADHGDDEVVLFPQLHTLCIDRILLFKDEPQSHLVYALHRFLARRISKGYPVLNLFLWTKPAFVAKLRDIFYDIVGLRIVWNDTTASGELVGHNLFCKGATAPL